MEDRRYHMELHCVSLPFSKETNTTCCKRAPFGVNVVIFIVCEILSIRRDHFNPAAVFAWSVDQCMVPQKSGRKRSIPASHREGQRGTCHWSKLKYIGCHIRRTYMSGVHHVVLVVDWKWNQCRVMQTHRTLTLAQFH